MSSETELAAVRRVLDAFLDDLAGRLSSHELEAVLAGRKDDLRSDDLGNKPEAYTESTLIFELLEAVGLESEPQPYGEAGGLGAWPDFEVTNLGAAVIGESKPPNNVGAAVAEVKDYLDRKSIGAEYGLATDGVEWYVFKIELGGDFTAYPEIDRVDLRPALQERARERGHVGSTSSDDSEGRDAGGVDAEESMAAFVSLFARDAFDELLTRTAPRRLRDERKRDVEAFYDLYIELLFGEGRSFSYETCLLDDVRSPPGADHHDEQLFAITLVNRLLFVKFLETRGVLGEGFLRERVRHYDERGDDLGGTLYETQIAPLFYDLLNTPPERRKPKHRRKDSWFASVPYLNGGLFRDRLPDERRYGVLDRILRVVIDDLIEGSRLELNGRGFDPAIVGSVFEKTINHIEQERTQKDVGAYYTPNDVTEIVVEQAVDPKIEDVLVEAFVGAAADDDDQRERIRAEMARMGLAEILRAVEDGEGWFGSPEAIRTAYERLGEITVLDPACGSGHFLTTAMDEIYRAQLSLLRGLNFGEDPDPQERYEPKVNLALNCIYGVDVDEIAVEIAKLRVWLKIVEGNGWQPEFGQLPNIDVNITDGNSLVGLPMTGTFDDVDAWSAGIREIERRRLEYKANDEGDPRELERFMADEIRPALDERYLSLFSRPVETEIASRREFEGIVERIDDVNLYPTLSSVQVKREDGAAITDDQTARLEDIGFSVYTKSARLDVNEAESELKRQTYVDHFETLADDLAGLFDDGFYMAAVERRPTAWDLDRVLGKPFHWMAEFPEVAEERGERHVINFDVILGNPPYGDLLGDAERLFISTYETDSIPDISANFVERQIQLLEDDGAFGNITTLRLVYQSDLAEFHDLLRARFDETKIACFAHRPQQVFPNAIVRVALLTGRKTDHDSSGTIRTSKFLQFDTDDRAGVLESISYRSTEGLELRERIGGEDRSYEILPKVGTGMIEGILAKLKSASSRIIADAATDDATELPVFRRRGGGYWLNAVPENIHGDSTTIEPVYFESEVERDLVFLVVNSSLFYLYWLTYGDFRHLNTGHITRFPIPDHEALRRYEDEITALRSQLWTALQEVHSGGIRDQFDMPQVKPTIDEVDVLLGEIYGLRSEEMTFLQQYNTEYGRRGPENASIE